MKNRRLDIERYLRGELSPAEMHALEREALDDPFLAEALEGIEHAGTEDFLYDVHQLRRLVDDRLHRRRRGDPRTVRVWAWASGIAATLLLIAISGFFAVSLLRQQSTLSKAEDPPKVSAPTSDTLSMNTKSDSAASAHQPLAMETPRARPSTKSQLKDPQKQKREAASKKEIDEPLAESGLQGENESDNAAADLALADVTAPAAERVQPAPESLRHAKRSASESVAEVITVVKGTVMSTEGEALPGVNVSILGTSVGTVTDPDGRYEIAVPADTTLVFSFIGYEQLEAQVAPGSIVDITLNEDITALSEVVIVSGTGNPTGSSAPATFTTAEPEGGKRKFMQYLDSAVVYPQQALNNNVAGRVTVRFTVGADGRLSGFEVLRGIGYGCEEALIEAIQQGPAWRPSLHGSRAIKDEVKVRFKFAPRRNE